MDERKERVLQAMYAQSALLACAHTCSEPAQECWGLSLPRTPSRPLRRPLSAPNRPRRLPRGSVIGEQSVKWVGKSGSVHAPPTRSLCKSASSCTQPPARHGPQRFMHALHRTNPRPHIPAAATHICEREQHRKCTQPLPARPLRGNDCPSGGAHQNLSGHHTYIKGLVDGDAFLRQLLMAPPQLLGVGGIHGEQYICRALRNSGVCEGHKSNAAAHRQCPVDPKSR